MREEPNGLRLRVGELRRAFDRSFSESVGSSTEVVCDLLAIRVAGDAYALRLDEVGGLFVDRIVTPLPSPVPELLGIVGFRAALAPVYDLPALLGYAGSEALRWMVSTAGVGGVALAFHQFEEHLRIPRSALAADRSGAHRHVREVAHAGGATRPVIHLPSVVEAIQARARSAAPSKEQ
jgi:hypothetical protein